MYLGVRKGHQITSQKIVLESIDDKSHLGSQIEDNRLQLQQDLTMRVQSQEVYFHFTY